MADYSFVTIWKFSAPIDDVWDVLHAWQQWPDWWPSLAAIEELEVGDEDGVGSLRRFTWKTPFGYKLKFDMRITEVRRPEVIDGKASGELTGTGRWTLFESDGVTAVRYDWNVRTTLPWMNLLAPLARPLFVRNHNLVMRAGGEGLANQLQVSLLEES